MDGLTTNGVLVMHPAGEFVSEPAPGVWREISVCGNVFALRETRSAQQRGKLVRPSGVYGKISQILTSIWLHELTTNTRVIMIKVGLSLVYSQDYFTDFTL